jgi:hypothetical protein
MARAERPELLTANVHGTTCGHPSAPSDPFATFPSASDDPPPF